MLEKISVHFAWLSLPGLVGALLAFILFFWLIRQLFGRSGRIVDRVKEDTIPLIVGICAAILTFYFIERRLLVEAGVHVEVVSIIVQFLFLILLGGAVTTIYQARLQRRAEEERHKTERAAITERDRILLQAMHDDLVTAYNRAKRVRRLLRARLEYPDGNSGRRYVPKSVYNEQMEQIIDAELDFEAILRRIEGNVPLFGKNSRLDGCLDDVEKYLTDTVKEFRSQLRNFEGDPPRMDLAMLPRLEAFLGLEPRDGLGEGRHVDESTQHFKDQFRTAIQYLHKEINKRARRVKRTGYILWVDSRPENNKYEIGQLEEEGYEITIVKSSTEAEEFLVNGPRPLLIISNMGRTEHNKFNPRAGLDMFKRITTTAEGIPVLFYTTYESVIEHQAEVENLASGSITDSRLQLFRFVDECAEAKERIDQPGIGAEPAV